MRKELHIAAINCVLQDVKDRSFIGGVKRCIDNMPEDIRKEKDVKCTLEVLSNILDDNITEKKEILLDFASKDYSDDIKCQIDENTKYSRKFRKDLLDLLNASSVRSNVLPMVNSIVEALDEIHYNTNDGKAVVNALSTFMDNLDSLHKTAYKSKVSTGSSNILIMDPDENTTHGTLDATIKELREADMFKIKTIEALDMIVGGGFAPKSLTVFAAYTGHGKSLIMQNLILYASKNNERQRFDVAEGFKPCIIFISLELTKKQLLERHLAWCGHKIPATDLANMKDKDIEKLVIDANKQAGLQIPIMYIERLNGDMSTNIMDIEDEMNNCFNAGFQPVLTIIDYVDRLDVFDVKARSLGSSGSDGSMLLKQKVRECRELGVRKNVPVVTAAQLSGEVGTIISEIEKTPKKLDVLPNVPQSFLAGSKYLGAEVEYLIFCNKTEIEERDSESDRNIVKKNFLSMCVKKDRDGHSRYYKSTRDKENEAAYLQYTRRLSMEPNTKRFMSSSGENHVVIPMNGFNITDDDYGRSIRMFYLGSDNTSFQQFDSSSSMNDDMSISFDSESEEALARDLLENM